MMTMQEIVKQLKDFKSKAEYRSRRLFENGVEILPEWKAKDEGVAEAYGYCILLLERLWDGETNI